MKELSIEEKAKAYDKVSKEVKDFFEGKQKMYNDVNQTLEHLFPELKESEDERIVKCLLNYFHHVRYNGLDLKGTDVDEVLAWLEKQGEQKSLYIRFGDVPNNEKSKIYRGEKEIGEENGVSVYPAFEVNGNIVLGLTLPIKKTTLHTQQHLLEYDDRPCYLVKGNYVGKDTDGQPLIDNVHIIRKIDSYRVKEEKVDDANKVEPKFKVGEWLCENEPNNYARFIQILEIVNVQGKDRYRISRDIHNDEDVVEFDFVEKYYHKFDIKDAKDGDVLTCYSDIKGQPIEQTGIIKQYVGRHGGCSNSFKAHFGVDWDNRVVIEGYMGSSNIYPSTKEQRDFLFQKMKEAGYEWSDKDRKLIKTEEQSEQGAINDTNEEISEELKAASILHSELVRNQSCIDEDFIDGALWLKRQIAWSEEDEDISVAIENHLREYYVEKKGYPYVADENSPEMKEYRWLKNIKDRITNN